MAIEQVLMNGFLTEVMAAAAPAASQQGGGMGFMFTMVLMIVVFYFLLIRPQNKKAKEHRELVGRLGKGDEVITGGGIVGKIIDVSDQYITVQIADGVDIIVQRHHVGVVLPKDTIKSLRK